MNLVYLLFVFTYEMVSQDWPHKEKEQRLRKIEFIMLSAPRDRGLQSHVEQHQGGQEAEDQSA